MTNLLFDQYQRYKNTELIINKLRNDNETFRILEVGANEHKNLEKFLPLDDITYLDISLTEELMNDPKYILGDASEMSFLDNEFDIIVALDVYEHILLEKRGMFVKELNRVAKYIFIIAAPFGDEETKNAEYRANLAYRSLYNVDHIWLAEHIEIGLPNFDETIQIFKDNKIDFTCFNHGQIDLWEKMTTAYFYSICSHDLIAYKSNIDYFYNKYVFDYDYDDKSYRKFIIGNKNRKFEGIAKKLFDKNEIYSIKSSLYNMIDVFYNMLNIILRDKQSVNIIETLDFKLNQLSSKLDYLVDKNKNYFIQIYLDYGNGFIEEQSQSIGIFENLKITKVQKEIYLNDCENILQIRFDPLNENCAIVINKILGVKKNGESINLKTNMKTNAEFCLNDIYIFLTKDPQIYFDENNINFQYLIIELDYIISDYETLVLLKKDMDERIRELNKINQIFIETKANEDLLNIKLSNYIELNLEKQNEIESLLNKLSEKEVKINSLISDFSERELKITTLINEISEKELKINSLINEDAEKLLKINSLISQLEFSSNEYLSEISNLKEQIKEKDIFLSSLEAEKNKIENNLINIKKSRLWKVRSYLKKDNL